MSGTRITRTNIIAEYLNKKLISPLVFQGSCDANLVESWIENMLSKELNSNSLVVMIMLLFINLKE